MKRVTPSVIIAPMIILFAMVVDHLYTIDHSGTKFVIFSLLLGSVIMMGAALFELTDEGWTDEIIDKYSRTKTRMVVMAFFDFFIVSGLIGMQHPYLASFWFFSSVIAGGLFKEGTKKYHEREAKNANPIPDPASEFPTLHDAVE